jgi:hypothetical protein
MHEQMHQRAEQERKEDQGAKHVSVVLGEQEHAGDHEEADEDEAGARLKKVPQ